MHDISQNIPNKILYNYINKIVEFPIFFDFINVYYLFGSSTVEIQEQAYIIKDYSKWQHVSSLIPPYNLLHSIPSRLTSIHIYNMQNHIVILYYRYGRT